MFLSKRKREPANYMLQIESFSLLSKAKTPKIESDVFKASGHKWRLDLYLNGNNEENDDNQYISLYVVICDTERCAKGWEVCVDVSFFVYDHLNRNYVTFQDANWHRPRFHEKKKEWGFDRLISLDSFMESENGYLFNDSCVFGAEISLVFSSFPQLDRCLEMTKPPITMNTHTWIINNFSAVTEDKLKSEVFKVGKVKWELLLYPKGNLSSEGTHLSIYLGVHDAASLPNGWKVYAEFKLRLKSQALENDMEKEANCSFTDPTRDWGFKSFMPLSELNDSGDDFLLNDNLTIEVEISVMGTFKYFV